MPNEDKWYISGPLGIGALEPAGKLDVRGDIRAGNSDLYFTKTDHEHTGIGNTTGYAAIENASNFDALMILGRTGTDQKRKVRLWDYLEVHGPLAVHGDIRAGNSDIYFTKTDHEHSGIGNTPGYAAIENASNFDALMILGRTGADTKRRVRLWDFLEVHGPLNVTADLIVGAGGNAVMKTRHIEGKNGQNDDPDMLYLNWHSGKDVQVGEPSRRSNLAVWGNVGIGTANPVAGKLQFDNGGGNKIVIYDNGPADRYGLGLNSGNLNAFVPAGGRFSVRQNGHDGTEIMAITGAGNVGIGTISPDVTLHLGKGVPGAQARIQLDNANGQKAQINRWTNRLEISASDAITHTIDLSNGTSKEVLIVKWEGINVNGQAWKSDGGNWAKPSDLRLKKNVASLKASLDQLLKLRGVIFEWKEPEKHGNLTGVQRGFIAQEVEQVFPEWVGEDSNGSKFLTIYGFEALTIEGFREIKDNIDSLSKRIQTIESAVNRNGTTRLEVDGLQSESFC